MAHHLIGFFFPTGAEAFVLQAWLCELPRECAVNTCCVLNNYLYHVSYNNAFFNTIICYVCLMVIP